MKKTMLTILALVLAICCSFALAEAADETGFTLTFTANPTTGYDWEYVVDEEIVAVTQEVLTSADIDKLAGVESSEEPMTGEGCFYVYTIKGVKPGKALIAFEYSQNWDKDSTVVGITYELQVNDDLSVVCLGSTVGV